MGSKEGKRESRNIGRKEMNKVMMDGRKKRKKRIMI